MRIAIGNGTAVGRHALGLGEDTDARTHEEETTEYSPLDNLIFDQNTEVFVQSEHEFSTLSQHNEMINSDVPLPNVPPPRKKFKTNDFKGKATSSEPNNSQSNIMDKLTQSVDKLVEAMNSFDKNECSCWDLIKQLPLSDDRSRFRALKLLNTRAKKNIFSLLV